MCHWSFSFLQILRGCLPLDALPTAQTCFFQLRLPCYSSKEVMAKKLIYAIRHCRTIDMDYYMLARENHANNEFEDAAE